MFFQYVALIIGYQTDISELQIEDLVSCLDQDQSALRHRVTQGGRRGEYCEYCEYVFVDLIFHFEFFSLLEIIFTLFTYFTIC